MPTRRFPHLVLICVVGLLPVATALAEEKTPTASLEGIALSKDKRSFILASSGRAFSPWGFNYDHDPEGRLLEDYWDEEWQRVTEDFREMKQLGANVVRIHLQLGKFMEGPDKPRKQSLDQLARLVQLAEKEKLYLDVTGLGCYHKKDVPDWYDRLGEKERWQVQGRFWQAVAGCCAESPAIFCYDLMNEPVVPGGAPREDWLGPAFAGKHFVQFITLDLGKRDRPAVARAWTRQLVEAIRTKDRRHLITVGLVPWSLDRKGLTSGFVPEKVAPELDFLCVHIYPEKGKIDDALETLAGFAAAGKPVVIEEIFPLKCSPRELEQFVDGAKKHAVGLIGFYWGRTPDELRRSGTIGDAIMLSWLEFFQKQAKEGMRRPENKD